MENLEAIHHVKPEDYLGKKTAKDDKLINRFKLEPFTQAVESSSMRDLHRILYLAASGELYLRLDDGRAIEKEIKKRFRRNARQSDSILAEQEA